MSNKIHVTRHQSREEAFILLYEKCFNDAPIEEIIENALLSRDFTVSEFARTLINGVDENKENIDNIIEDNLKGWKKNRLSKVALTLMRISVFEMLNLDSVPVNVSINEAIELAKVYSTDKDSSFINGVLGAVAKTVKKDE